MRLWVGFDVGKAFHWVCVLDEEGEVVLSRGVEATERDLESCLQEISGLGGERTFGIDLLGGPATLLEAVLTGNGERVFYLPGTAVNRARDGYPGESKSDRRDARVIADQISAAFPGALSGGEVLGLGDIDRLHSYTYVGDVAAGLATLGEHPESDGRVWHLPTAPAVTTRQVHAIIEERVGRPLNVVVLDEPRPYGPFDGVFMDEYAELFYQYFEDQVVDSSAFQRTFGVGPTPPATALDATIDWYRGWLTVQ